MFPREAIAVMRQLNEDNLSDTCTVFRSVTVREPGGVNRSAWGKVYELDCRFSVFQRSNERMLSSQIMERAQSVVTFALGSDVRTTDMLYVITRDEAGVVTSRWLKPIGMSGPTSTDAMRRVYCEDTRPPEGV